MLKPVLLLVDDDREVLRAIESRLEPVFGSVCRVESFDDSASVLPALAAWNEEGRLVAVAIVDQRMPGMSGTQLIEALHQSTCGEDAHVALLTGYADLDEAIEAKNRGRIARYLQKPEDVAAITDVVRDLMVSFCGATDEAEFYMLEELTDRVSLLDAFRLRLEVYREDPHVSTLIDPHAEFDVDGYDARSVQIGLYAQRPGAARNLIGTSRIVTAKPQATADVVPDLLPPAPGFDFPVLEYWAESEGLRTVVEQWRREGKRVTEGSRMTVRADVRGRVAAGFIAAGTIQRWWRDGNDMSFLGVRQSHVRFWTRQGFERMEKAELKKVRTMDGACVVLRRDAVPARTQEAARAEGRRIERGLPACRCDVWPRCAGAPHETGDFAAVDLLCPVAAEAVLTRVEDEA